VIPGGGRAEKALRQLREGWRASGDTFADEAKKNLAQSAASFKKALYGDKDANKAGEAIATPLTDAVQRWRDAAQFAASSVDKAQTQAGSQSSVVAQVRINSADLKAIVVGSSEGESFRNSIMRGADPRLDVKEDAKRTADNTERAADALDEMASNLTGFGLATLTA
jgi:hypothetical protein